MDTKSSKCVHLVEGGTNGPQYVNIALMVKTSLGRVTQARKRQKTSLTNLENHGDGSGYLARDTCSQRNCSGGNCSHWQHSIRQQPWGSNAYQGFGGGLGGPKAKEAPTPMQWGPRWSQREGGPHAHVLGASVVPKRRRPARPCGGGLGGPKAKEAPGPMRCGPRWSQRQRGPHAQVVGTPLVPKRSRPPGPCAGGLGDPEAMDAPTPMC